VKITPDFIPHHKFHEGSWLLPVEKPDWYYFKKGENKNHISNKNFIKTVDRPLKELVTYLHSKGIRTTPSCAGHHFAERKFEKVYDALRRDKKRIRNGGLLLKDSETGKMYVYKDEEYNLPWTKRTFLKTMMSYQKQGVIGIRLRNKKLRQRLLQLEIPNVKITEKNSLLLIMVMNGTGYNSKSWKKTTEELKQIL
jgi:hypothetical protein